MLFNLSLLYMQARYYMGEEWPWLPVLLEIALHALRIEHGH